MFPSEITALAESVIITCQMKGLTIATAESCTGGLLSAALTSVPGSSEVFERGFVTYSNQAKMDMLGVAELAIQGHGAVSKRVAETMAVGALVYSGCSLSAGITGIAGPGGGSDDKPVGLVHIAVARAGFEDHIHEKHTFEGDRDEVRYQTLKRALWLLEHASSR